MYFTPRPIVDTVLDLVERLLPPDRPLAFIDPACGAGAFLGPLGQRFPSAQLLGLDLSAEALGVARTRAPTAQLFELDALRTPPSRWLSRLSRLTPACFEVWIGNPPYNGTSPLLTAPAELARLKRRLGISRLALPKGTSLRDDFVFFLLLAAARLSRREGLLAFVTSASLLDSFLYAPLRRHLLSTLDLLEVVELGAGLFAGTRVATCVTVWSTPRLAHRPRHDPAPRYHARRGLSDGSDPAGRCELEDPRAFTPRPPELILRPLDGAASALDEAWRRAGEPLDTLVPVSLAGLKTRFDELLVDEDPRALVARVAAFLAAHAEELESFARDHDIPPRCLPKLAALHASLPSGMRATPDHVRPLFRYAGARHRDVGGAEATQPPRAYCYLDRRLIPRGDHRLRGEYDPHAHPVKLVFNARELPLSALLVQAPGCVPAHRHTRFAPLMVPLAIREGGLSAARRDASALGSLVPNLSSRGLALAARAGDPLVVYARIAAFINSREVQEVWAPTFGRTRALPVPDDTLLNPRDG